MKPDDFKDRFNKFWDAFGGFLEKYEKANPEWIQITLLRILYQAVENLRDLVENPGEKRVTWETPFVELGYPVQADWEKVEPLYFHVTAADLEDPERIRATFAKGFLTVKESYVLSLLTQAILVIIKGGKAFYRTPVSLDKKLAKLSKKERDRRIEKILKPWTKITRLGLYDAPLAGKKRAKISLAFQFFPCVLNVDKKRAFYPIVIGLEFRGIQPKDIDEEARAAFWTGLLQGIKEAIPKEDLGFLKRPRTEPTVRPVTKEAPPVKASLHTELAKIGHKPDPRQPGLFDKLLDDTRKDVESKGIDVIGIDITPAQEQSLHALQMLLTRTNYKGNLPSEYIEDRAFKFRGNLPALEFSPVKYLEAYGLKKHLTRRGQEEYSPKERAEALQALVDLAKKPFLLVYKTEYWKENPTTKKRELRIDRIETTDTLIKIIRGWEALTKKEDSTLDRGSPTEATDEKLKAIAIKPAPILVQDIDSYFLLKPANYLQEINMKYPWPNRPSRFTIRLINWLRTQAELKRRNGQPLVIETSLETIAYALHMDAFIKTRQFKRIRDIITKGYKISQELGYLLSYSTVQGQTKELERLELNPEKFNRDRETGAQDQAGDKDIAH